MLKTLPFPFPNEKTIRVITDTDAYNECDDQYAVAHLWMTPKFDNCAMIAEQYGTMRDENSEQMSYNELQNLAKLMGLDDQVKILHGAPTALPDEKTPVDSEGARFIIEEALRDDPRPLFICNLGAVTNLASAYLLEPKIADKITVIWIGGAPYPEGGFEFNQNNDLNAANVLFKSKMKLWQVPSNVYTTMRVSFMELVEKVYPCGAIGKYLVENTMNFQKLFAQIMPQMVEMILGSSSGSDLAAMASPDPAEMATSYGGEIWSLGDSPVVGLMLNNMLGDFTIRSAPYQVNPDGTYDLTREGSRKIHVYDNIDSRFILNDLYAKLHYYFG